VLDPAGLRKDLPEFLLGGSENGTGLIEDDRAGARRPLIECEDAAHGRFSDRVGLRRKCTFA
jgi:hypothetical protein